MKTLESLTVPYQCGVSRDDYEVIIIENPSSEMLDSEWVNGLGDQFRYFAMESNSPSPVDAVNFGIAQARAPVTGLMVDGARLLSPGVLQYALMAYKISENAVVSVPGYHLGEQLQQQAVDSGYNEQVEAELLASINWPSNGYDLFQIACLSGSCAGGFFRPISESNCLFASTKILNELGGCDSGFKAAGGGFVNLDLYRRLCEHPDVQVFLLPGEGTFHQYHGGVTTSKAHGDRDRVIVEMHDEYQQLRGCKFTAPNVQTNLLGNIHKQVMPFVLHSVQRFMN